MKDWLQYEYRLPRWWLICLLFILGFGSGALSDARAATVRQDGNRLTATCQQYSLTALRCTVWLEYTAKRRTRAVVWADGTFRGAGPRWKTRRVRLERGRNELQVRMTVHRFDYAYAWTASSGPRVWQIPGRVDGAAVGLRIGGRDMFKPATIKP